MFHWKEQLRFENPKNFWTYKQETFMRTMIHIFRSCQHGTRSHELNTKAMAKYLRLLQLTLVGLIPSDCEDFEDPQDEDDADS